MEPGLKLLIQWVLEFAPVIADLVQVYGRNEASLAGSKYQQVRDIQEFIETVNGSIQTTSSLWGFEQEKLLQRQFAVYHRETQLKIAAQERETTLKLPEIHKILDNWPLRLYPSQILKSHNSHGSMPLRIFLAPPKVPFEKFDNVAEGIPEIELMLAEGLREFLNKHYSLHSQVRPTEFLAGAWESKRFHSESSIKALFGMLKSEPTLILESEIDGDYLNFRIAYWGFGPENYYYKTISRLPYRKIVYESAKHRALEWKKIRDELVALGENLEELNKIGRDNVINLAILEKEETWKTNGIDVSKLSLQYQVNRQDFEKLCQVLIACHCLVAGWVADAYHLVHYDVAPLLPELLPSLLKDALDLQSVQAIVTGYKQIYEALEDERRYWVPELALQLAQSLCHLPDKSWAKEQVDYSVNTWLQLRQGLQPKGAISVPYRDSYTTAPATIDIIPHSLTGDVFDSNGNCSNLLEAMQSALRIEDQEYVQKLREYFAAIGDSQGVAQVETLLRAIAELKRKLQLEHVYLSHTFTGHSGKVSSVALSPDRQTLVSGCLDKTIMIWSLSTGKLLRTLTGHSGEVSSVALSPDGQFLASGSYDCPKSNVKVWHLNTGKLLHTLLGQKKPVNFVTISPDGQILASGSNKIKIWNLHTGDRLCTLWHSCSVNSAAISPDGTILASGSSDNKIRLWNPRGGELLRTLTGHSGSVKSVAISPDGQTLMSGSADKTVKIWRLSTGELLQTLTGHSDEVKSVAIIPVRAAPSKAVGQIVVSGSADKTVKIWRLSTGELLQTLTGHSGAVNSVALSWDGQLIASGSSDKTIKIWQVVQEKR